MMMMVMTTTTMVGGCLDMPEQNAHIGSTVVAKTPTTMQCGMMPSYNDNRHAPHQGAQGVAKAPFSGIAHAWLPTSAGPSMADMMRSLVPLSRFLDTLQHNNTLCKSATLLSVEDVICNCVGLCMNSARPGHASALAMAVTGSNTSIRDTGPLNPPAHG